MNIYIYIYVYKVENFFLSEKLEKKSKEKINFINLFGLLENEKTNEVEKICV